MCDNRQIPCDALSAYHHVISTYRSTIKGKLCPNFAEMNRIHLVKGNDLEICKKRLKNLPRTFSPVAFGRSILKLAHSNRRNKDLFLLFEKLSVQ